MSDAVLATASPADHDLVWTTLGTMSGPLPGATRQQPANLLHNAEQKILVDCGDGATDQLRKAGVPVGAVDTVVISHLHVDHTAGLFGLIGRRRQAMVRGTIAVYGPPGTRQAVAEIQAAVGRLADLAGRNPDFARLPATTVEVTEISDGDRFRVGPVTVIAATNSHYGFEPGTSEATWFQSLSYRFEMADRSIVYTGDTGPSRNVERLAQDADLLVSEITDAAQVVGQITAANPDLPPGAMRFIRHHFEQQHLSADQVGLLAARSGVGSVVLTHNPLTEANMRKARFTIGAHFTGAIAFADDLDNY